MTPNIFEEQIIMIYEKLGVNINDSSTLFWEKLEDYKRVSTLRPIEEWHEDMGPCLLWIVPVEEPPYCGTPLDSVSSMRSRLKHPYTHFSHLPRAITCDKL